MEQLLHTGLRGGLCWWPAVRRAALVGEGGRENRACVAMMCTTSDGMFAIAVHTSGEGLVLLAVRALKKARASACACLRRIVVKCVWA